jgi:hypothetical protein
MQGGLTQPGLDRPLVQPLEEKAKAVVVLLELELPVDQLGQRPLRLLSFQQYSACHQQTPLQA